MRVVQRDRGITLKELISSVSPKGQVTIPIEIRRLLKVKPKDKVAFEIDNGEVKIIPVGSRLAAGFMSVPALERSLTLREMSELASEEHAQEAAAEGL